jgi:hypothetical protein
MGERGPAPRREAEVRRTNNKGTAIKLSAEDLSKLPFEIDLEPEPPADGEHWTPVVRDLWESLKVDPARKWMTSADWALTKVVLELLNQAMTQEDENGVLIGVNGATQTAVLKHMASIGITEASRLRLQKEITLFPIAPVDTEGNVTNIADVRREAVQ